MRECGGCDGHCLGGTSGRCVDFMFRPRSSREGCHISVPGQLFEFAVECVPRPLGAQVCLEGEWHWGS